MKLMQWMRDNQETDESLMNKINDILKTQGVKPYSWRSVQPWRRGDCVPKPMIVAAIRAVTHGAVTYEDHVENCREAGFRVPHHPRKQP